MPSVAPVTMAHGPYFSLKLVRFRTLERKKIRRALRKATDVSTATFPTQTRPTTANMSLIRSVFLITAPARKRKESEAAISLV